MSKASNVRTRRRPDARHWAVSVVQRTWVPAFVMVALLTAAGAALQYAARSARSIGGVLRALRAE